MLEPCRRHRKDTKINLPQEPRCSQLPCQRGKAMHSQSSEGRDLIPGPALLRSIWVTLGSGEQSLTLSSCRTVNNRKGLRFTLSATWQVSLPQFSGCWQTRDSWVRDKGSDCSRHSKQLQCGVCAADAPHPVHQGPWGDAKLDPAGCSILPWVLIHRWETPSFGKPDLF